MTEPILAVDTRTLFAAIPYRVRVRKIARGNVPRPMNPPPDCPFHTLCPHVVDRRRTEMQPPTERAAGHLIACQRAVELPQPNAAGVDRLAPAAARRMALYAQRREQMAVQ
jgi:oligopeptide transport system ATP-binding protein